MEELDTIPEVVEMLNENWVYMLNKKYTTF